MNGSISGIQNNLNSCHFWYSQNKILFQKLTEKCREKDSLILQYLMPNNKANPILSAIKFGLFQNL